MKMTKNRKRVLLGCLITLAVYCGSYAYFRVTGGLIHVRNRSHPTRGHEVKAPNDEWIDVLSGMADNLDSALVKVYAAEEKIRPKILDVVFYPLRKCEATWWNLTEG